MSDRPHTTTFAAALLPNILYRFWYGDSTEPPSSSYPPTNASLPNTTTTPTLTGTPNSPYQPTNTPPSSTITTSPIPAANSAVITATTTAISANSTATATPRISTTRPSISFEVWDSEISIHRSQKSGFHHIAFDKCDPETKQQRDYHLAQIFVVVRNDDFWVLVPHGRRPLTKIETPNNCSSIFLQQVERCVTRECESRGCWDYHGRQVYYY